MDASSTVRQNAHAIVIGIDHYQSSQIPNLGCAARDARQFYQQMTAPDYGGIPEENAILLLNEEATYQKIRSTLGNKLLPEQEGKEVVFIFFAGYGSLVDTGEENWQKLLLPYDANPDNLPEKAVHFSEINDFFNYMSAREVICFLDCSFAGEAGGRSFITASTPQDIRPGDSIAASLAGEGRVIVTACGDSETALEFPNAGHGLFSYYLLEGLNGAADNDRDGAVGIDELYKYVYSNVSHKARRYDGNMHPVRKGSLRGKSLVSHYNVAEAESPQALQRRIHDLYTRAAKAHKEGDIRVVEDLMQQVLAINPGEDKARQILKLVEKKRAQARVAAAPVSKPEPAEIAEEAAPAPEVEEESGGEEPSAPETAVEEPPEATAAEAAEIDVTAPEVEEKLPAAMAAEPAETEVTAPEAEEELPAEEKELHEEGSDREELHADDSGGEEIVATEVSGETEAPETSVDEIIDEVEAEEDTTTIGEPDDETTPAWKRWLKRIFLILLFSAVAILAYFPFLNRDEELQMFESLPKSYRPLRAEPALVSMEEMKAMLKTHNFYERDWNPGGKGFKNKLEPVFGTDLVIDFADMLMWQKSGSGSPLRFEEALAYIEKINQSGFGGYNDWRLPTLEEALSLLEPRQAAEGHLNISHLFDTTQRWIWTADDENSKRKWTVSFYDGFCYPNDVRYKEFFVRAVR